MENCTNQQNQPLRSHVPVSTHRWPPVCDNCSLFQRPSCSKSFRNDDFDVACMVHVDHFWPRKTIYLILFWSYIHAKRLCFAPRTSHCQDRNSSKPFKTPVVGHKNVAQDHIPLPSWVQLSPARRVPPPVKVSFHTSNRRFYVLAAGTSPKCVLWPLFGCCISIVGVWWL